MRRTGLVLLLALTACGGTQSAVTTTSATPTTSEAPPTTVATTTTIAVESTTTTMPRHGRIEVGPEPCALEVDPNGAPWITLFSSAQVVQVGDDAVTETVEVADRPCGIAFADGSLWVAALGPRSVIRYDLDGTEVARVDIGGRPWDLQPGFGSLWATNQDGSVVHRIDPVTAESVEIEVGPTPGGIAVTPDAIWVAVTGAGRVVAIDPATNELATEVEIEGSPVWFAESADWLWVSHQEGAMSLIDPVEGSVLVTVESIGARDGAMAFGSVWVPGFSDGEIDRLDPETGEVVDRFTLESGIFVAEPVGDQIWVLDFNGRSVFTIDVEG